jgi:hypothetical protein
MRSSVLIASAWATGAFAIPREPVRIITETATRYVTVYVTVTPGAGGALPVSRQPSILISTPDARPTSKKTTRTSTTLTYSPNAWPTSKTTTRTSTTLTYSPNAWPTSKTLTTSPRTSSQGAPASIIATPISIKAPSSLRVPTSSTRATSLAPIPSSSARSVAPPAASSSTAPQTGGALGQHISGPSQASLSSGTEYRNAILYHHNAARANHGAGTLTWCDDCEANARIAAQRCTFEHYIPDGVFEGQNLFTVSGTVFNVTAAITESWYKSEFGAMMGHYGQANLPDDVFHKVGHLTQLVWKDTTSVGCVSLDCGDRMMVNGQLSKLNKYTVCNYAPAGNVGDEYADNVGSPISTTNLGSWTD